MVEVLTNQHFRTQGGLTFRGPFLLIVLWISRLQARRFANAQGLRSPSAAAFRMHVANFTLTSVDRCCIGSVSSTCARTSFKSEVVLELNNNAVPLP